MQSSTKPIEALLPPPTDQAQIVVVCPTRGVPTFVEMNQNQATRKLLEPGGSVVFVEDPGEIVLKAHLLGAGFSTSELTTVVAVGSGEARFFTVDYFGSADGFTASRFSPNQGPSLPMIPSGVRLVQIPPEKAARIAVY